MYVVVILYMKYLDSLIEIQFILTFVFPGLIEFFCSSQHNFTMHKLCRTCVMTQNL